MIKLFLLFLGLGWSAILFVCAFIWIIPWMGLVYIAGWLSHARPWPELKNYKIWEWLRNHYFKFKVIGELPEEGPVIYAIYPHGHFSISAVFYFALNPKFANSRAAVHSLLFWIPIFGSFVRWINAIPVVEDEMVKTLLGGSSIYMCPGGIADILNTGTNITKRSGFLRVARKAKVDVIPIWCPMERHYYSHWAPFNGLIPIIIWGLWWFPFLPRSVSNYSPILIGKRINPTNEDDFWSEMDKLQEQL
jgi:1-acyl-sn-glycerol-3-phosphate acyltransferase